MALNFDFSGMERKEVGDFTPLPKGDYILTIADAEVKQKQGSEYPYLALTFEVEGIKVWENLTFHPNSQWKIRQLLEAVSGAEIDGAIDMDEKDLVGQQVMAVLGVRNRQDDPDKKQNHVVAYKLSA